MLVGMHRHVTRHVVENIRLGQVVQVIPAADRDGGRELTVAQAVEKQEGGYIAADSFGLKSGERLQEAIDVLQTRHPVMVEIQGLQPGSEMPVRITLPAGQHAAVQSAPCPMVLLRVKVVGLVDIEAPILASLFNERCLRGGETRHETSPSL